MTARSATFPPAPAPGHASVSRTTIAVWIAIALFSLWLRSGFPVRAIGFAVDDDALFVRLAGSIGTGRWLGPYDALTFVKGMFYPGFIAVTHLAHIPLKLAEQAVFLAAAALTASSIARAGQVWLATVLYALLALDPVLWTWSLARVIREGLYIGQTMALVGLLVILLTPSHHPDGARGTRPFARQIAVGVVFGLVLGSFWLTREEGVWILPALASMLTVRAIGVVAARPSRATVRRDVWPTAAALAAAASVFGVSIAAVMLTNDVRYGYPVTVDVKSASFLDAYGALSRIRHARFQRFVVFPRDARRLAYAVSPAARELAPTLDGPRGAVWVAVGCRQTRSVPCDEILSGWFQWAFRDAVAAAGHDGSLADTIAFDRRLADEIDRACDRKMIHCTAPRAALAPPVRLVYLRDAIRDMPRELLLTLDLGRAEFGELPSVGSPLSLRVFRQEVGPINPSVGGRPSRWDAVVEPVAWPISRILGPIVTALFLPGLLGLVLSFRRPQTAARSPVVLLTLGSAIALLTRVALLSYLDATAIPSINTLYSSPATPFAIVVAVLGTALLANSVARPAPGLRSS